MFNLLCIISPSCFCLRFYSFAFPFVTKHFLYVTSLLQCSSIRHLSTANLFYSSLFRCIS
nr:MAG TPA: hypothetical protein [Ackermannviridae sp.]